MKAITRKPLLLASAAVAVMGLGMISTPAAAFDNVDWSWDKTVTENVLKDVTVTIDTAPSGMVEIEKKQDFIGDVTASSTVTNITNNPPGEGGQPAPAPGPDTFTIDLKAYYDDNAYGNPITNVLLLNDEETGLDLSNASGHVDNNHEKVYLTFDLSLPEEEPAPAPIPIGERDALDLPQVSSIATAVGNNQDITSSVSLELHDGQFLWGGYADPESTEEAAQDLSTLLGFTPNLGNTHTSGSAYLAFAGQLGLIEPATVSADSTVTGILNASVDSQATAVANNMSVELAAFTPDDAFMIADVTQHAYADVMATSLVDDVTVDGYSGFGAAGMGPGADQIPLVNSAATAVGNNFSVTVSSPEL